MLDTGLILLQYDLIPTSLHLQRCHFQTKSHSEVLGRTWVFGGHSSTQCKYQMRNVNKWGIAQDPQRQVSREAAEGQWEGERKIKGGEFCSLTQLSAGAQRVEGCHCIPFCFHPIFSSLGSLFSFSGRRLDIYLILIIKPDWKSRDGSSSHDSAAFNFVILFKSYDLWVCFLLHKMRILMLTKSGFSGSRSYDFRRKRWNYASWIRRVSIGSFAIIIF